MAKYGGGKSRIFRAPACATTAMHCVPTEALLQNYPNPFSTTTTIDFSLTADGHVLLNVYNTLGAEVATPANGYLPAGRHSVLLDGGALQDGLYRYKLTDARETRSGTMVVIH